MKSDPNSADQIVRYLAEGFNILAFANKAHDFIFARRGGVSFSNLQGRRGMFFIKTGGVLAG
jgi:hypothetical protein